MLTPTARARRLFAGAAHARSSGPTSAGRSPSATARTRTISPWRVTVSGGAPRRAETAVASALAARRSAPSSSGAVVGSAATTSEPARPVEAGVARSGEAGGRLGVAPGEQVLEQVAADAVAVGDAAAAGPRGTRRSTPWRRGRRSAAPTPRRRGPRPRVRRCRARRRSSPPRRRCGSSGTPRGSRRSATPRRARSAACRATNRKSRTSAGRPRRSTAHSRSWCVRMCPTTSSASAGSASR